jgi:predicted nicotinamide N-methyase
MTEDPAAFIRANTRVLCAAIVPEIRLYLAHEESPLWKMTSERLKGGDFLPPFWAFAWPGGQGAARYILDRPESVKGKRVLDFAAGSGLAAIAAMKAGAQSALAVDCDPLALEACKLNAALNDVRIEVAESVDFSKPPRKTDVFFAGDVCYEQAISTKLERWLRLCVEAGKDVFVCDPGRAYVPKDGMTDVASYAVPTSLDLELETSRTARIRKMERIKEGEEA